MTLADRLLRINRLRYTITITIGELIENPLLSEVLFVLFESASVLIIGGCGVHLRL